MNHNTYLEKMKALTIKLERAAKAEPYDPDAYNDVVEQLNSLFFSKGQRRRRLPWCAIITIVILMLILLWIVFNILFNLQIMELL